MLLKSEEECVKDFSFSICVMGLVWQWTCQSPIIFQLSNILPFYIASITFFTIQIKNPLQKKPTAKINKIQKNPLQKKKNKKPTAKLNFFHFSIQKIQNFYLLYITSITFP
jgi:hypothetical protein